MLILPKTLPKDILAAIQPLLGNVELEVVLPSITSAIGKLFGSAESVLVYQGGADEIPVGAFARAGAEVDDDFANRFFTRWYSSGIHGRVRDDLSRKLSAVSYSAFSWPYPRISVEPSASVEENTGEIGSYDLPREYSLLLPISANLIVRDVDQPEFFGYLALFFNGFPQISEDVVQLIITLPPLLSEICSRYTAKR